MRDAFGGTFMIQVFLVFILIYISFTALALNYAKAFKAKIAPITAIATSVTTVIETSPVASFILFTSHIFIDLL